VAAAGNSGQEGVHTPGSYPNVLCVANTTSEDKAAASTTYGPWVDVSAPGSDILSCVISSQTAYQKFTGTSMASPLVAGLAALVRSHKPELSVQQVMEQIRVTSDPIDELQQVRYHGKIGRGRINAYRALTEKSPAVRLLHWSLSDTLYGNGDGFPDKGEKLTVTMTWENLLEPTKNAVITLSSPSIRVTSIEPSTFQAGAIPTNGTVSNAADPFVIELEDWPVPNDVVDLLFTIEDGEYYDQGGVFFIQQPSYRDHDINDIRLTLTNDGNIGFDDLSSVTGSGLRYLDYENILTEGALIVGAMVNMTPLVVDVARSVYQEQSEDFLGEQLYRISTPGLIAEQEGYGIFWDANAPLADRLQTEITLKSFAFTRPDARNMIFLRYTIHNYSSNLQEQLGAGLFFDWDIGPNAQTNIALYEDRWNMALCYDSIGRPRTPVAIGTVHLTPEHGTNYWGINNWDRDDPQRIGLYPSFSKEEKWRVLRSGIMQPTSKITDVSQFIGAGPVDMQPGDSIVIAFALIAAPSPDEVRASVPTSLALWDTINRLYDPTDVLTPPVPAARLTLHGVSPHPVSVSGGGMTMDVECARPGRVRAELFDILGQKIAVLWDRPLEQGRHAIPVMLPRLAPGTVFLQVHGEGMSAGMSLRVIP
ncbi:MAG: S8 family serine peptidase, partial [Bacteroidetes bacterium]|nr:S8 family serine peptidase [Bacteroidota bacterium]